MTKKNQTQFIVKADAEASPTKHQLIVDLLSRPVGVSLAEMSAAINWLLHRTRYHTRDNRRPSATVADTAPTSDPRASAENFYQYYLDITVSYRRLNA